MTPFSFDPFVCDAEIVETSSFFSISIIVSFNISMMVAASARSEGEASSSVVLTT